MFKFEPTFNIGELKVDKNSRFRVVGEYDADSLLFSINTSTHTFLYLLTPTNDLTLVMSFRYFIDIISAELTDDQEFLFFTERIINNTSFTFRTTLWHVYSLSKQQIYEGTTPMTGFFIPKIGAKYQIITIYGQKIEHNEITFNDKKIKMSHKHGGIQIKDMVRFFFSRDPMYLAIFRPKKILEFYRFDHKGNYTKENYEFEINPESLLPLELALYPSIHRNLTIYKFTRSNFYVFPFGNEIGIIEQIYQGYNSVLTFAVSTVRDKYYEITAITGIDPDYPISFIQHGKIIFIFIINMFAAFVDFTTSPPVIFVLPTRFSCGPLTELSTNIRTSRIICDISNFKLYKCSFDMQDFTKNVDLRDKSILSLLAILCARLPYNINIPLLIDKMSSMKNGELMMHFFEWFFTAALAICTPGKGRLKKKTERLKKKDDSLKIPQNFVNAIKEMEQDYPSSGDVSRGQQFMKIVSLMLEKQGKKQANLCPEMAIKILRRHNEASLVLRTAVDKWIEKYKPDDEKIFITKMALMTEAQLSSAPSLPRLGKELEMLSTKICSKTMYETLKDNKAFGYVPPTSAKKREEQLFWSNRFSKKDIAQKEKYDQIALPRSFSSFALPVGPNLDNYLSSSSDSNYSVEM